MNDKQMPAMTYRVIAGLQDLVPDAPAWWVPWVAFGCSAVLLAGGVAFFSGWRPFVQRGEAQKVQNAVPDSTLKLDRASDARSEWWRRTQWALEATVSENVRMNDYGLKMLGALAKSKMADAQEKAMLDAVWQGSSTGMQDEAVDVLIADASEQEDQVLATLRREILAARLKVTLDEELTRVTSPTVKRLAKMALPPIIRSNDRDMK